MNQRPAHLAPQAAESFTDSSVAAAYRFRPTYSPEIFDILTQLISSEPRRVLDVGCGTGNIARSLLEYVEHVDAVDFSPSMIAEGKQLPGGDHPRLNWLCGKVEEIALEPPYALITAGESLHWMDWQMVLPRFGHLLTPGGYLALINQQTAPDPWSLLGELLPGYRTDAGYQPFDLIAELEQSHLFHKGGEQQTAPQPFVQSIDEYIESYHARAPFSRERMGPDRARAFDEEAREVLLRSSHHGTITLQVVATVLWGIPKGSPPDEGVAFRLRRASSNRIRTTWISVSLGGHLSLVIFGKSPITRKPSECSLHYPSTGTTLKPRIPTGRSTTSRSQSACSLHQVANSCPR